MSNTGAQPRCKYKYAETGLACGLTLENHRFLVHRFEGSAEGQAKELKAMQPQMPTEQEQIATLRAEVERLSRVERAFQEHLKDDVRESELRRLQPQGRQMDCDCPCDVCAIGTSKHCGKPPCDVAEAESSSAGPVWDESRIKKLVDAVWKADTPQGNFNDSTHTDYCVRAVIEQIVLGEFFPASQQVPLPENSMRCIECKAKICDCVFRRLCDLKAAASQQVDVREMAEAAKSLLEWMPNYSKGSSGYQRVERLRAAVLQKAMGAATPEATEDDLSRCAVCGWPLADSWQKGCVRGNCSMRPIPARFYNYERANKEYNGTLGERGAATAQPEEGKG